MEAVIKPILVQFLKTDSSSINTNTVIDKTAVKGSILVHRMYGALANAGVVVTDYISIRTYGELLEKLNTNGNEVSSMAKTVEMNPLQHELASVGIDIEHVKNMPSPIDYRQDEFYRQNFSAQEISYCVLQPNPMISFTGLFAAKEAIVKADNGFLKVPFNQIEIDHDQQGKPIFGGLGISISHREDFVVAVALKALNTIKQDQELPESVRLALAKIEAIERKLKTYSVIAFGSLVVAIATGTFFFLKYING